VSINAVKPVYDVKIKTQVGRKAIPQEKPSTLFFEEYIMAQMNITKDMTSKQRLAVIKRHAKKFNQKLKRNQRVRKTETESIDPYGNENIYAWTDAPKYVDEYYGDRARAQSAYERDWD
jgi:hypothetical protein|tara:strand:+ start:681 stop:1037 length:357 start_codon:yes stop_codon:yes gene_type:complete